MTTPNTNFDQVSAITQKKFLPKLVDNIFDSNPLLKMMKESAYDQADGGTQIVQPLNYATTSSSGFYSGADTLLIDDNDAIAGAAYDWKQLYASIVLNRLDELKNSGTAAVLKLSKQKMEIAEKTMKDSLGTAMYNLGTDSKALAGLRYICSTSNSPGGISQSSNSWWRAQVDSSTTTLSISAMQTLFNLCSIDNDTPTHIYGRRADYDRYYALLQPQQRFQGEKEAAGGFSSLLFNGKPFVADSHAPGIFFINNKYLRLMYHPDENFRMSDFVKPANQNLKIAQIFWAGALVASNNRMLGYMSAITA